MVKTQTGDLEPFDRDKLFISIYLSCRHRSKATHDATALLDTIISQVLTRPCDSIIERRLIVETAHKILRRFDKVAATIYAAYHPL